MKEINRIYRISGKPRRGLQIMDTRMGFPCPFRNVVIDYFSQSIIKLEPQGALIAHLSTMSTSVIS